MQLPDKANPYSLQVHVLLMCAVQTDGKENKVKIQNTLEKKKNRIVEMNVPDDQRNETSDGVCDNFRFNVSWQKLTLQICSYSQLLW